MSEHKLLLLSKYAQEYQRLIAAAGLPGLELVVASSPGEARAQAADCDLVFGEPVLIREVLPRLPRLRWVQVTWAGVEPLLGPEARRDYLLTNARGVFGDLMSEYVFAYLLLHERRILARYLAQQDHRWDATETGVLRGKRIGLLGVGSIGAVLAHTAKHFKMSVYGYTRGSEGCPDVDAYYHGAALLAFAFGLDYLVSLLPGTPETHHLVNASLLGALPARAVFVSVGRGSVVDEDALAEALRTGRLAGAVLDVFEQEPLPPEHIFWSTPNLLISSHTAAPSFPEDVTGLFIENYRLFLEGQALKYRVDFERGY
ncbi:MAG: D-2-hydroxyacid dehydrogenase [Anaerolineales bacterium]